MEFSEMLVNLVKCRILYCRIYQHICTIQIRLDGSRGFVCIGQLINPKKLDILTVNHHLLYSSNTFFYFMQTSAQLSALPALRRTRESLYWLLFLSAGLYCVTGGDPPWFGYILASVMSVND